ncbi:hypothetical protein FQN60_003383 [Etheostoma spectabile]|uniref:MsrB domain-containing protein n=1 Tax=Etheostoma spectabile TaxID=54343 RepID=A0A5J5CIT3_9PERO|nr:hypothetical protein FQN60_003383 [Etheostoma spectabile]
MSFCHFSGGEVYKDHFKPGMYVCSKCNHPLFSSRSKFAHSSPWPAFTDTVTEDSVTRMMESLTAYKARTSSKERDQPVDGAVILLDPIHSSPISLMLSKYSKSRRRSSQGLYVPAELCPAVCLPTATDLTQVFSTEDHSDTANQYGGVLGEYSRLAPWECVVRRASRQQVASTSPTSSQTVWAKQPQPGAHTDRETEKGCGGFPIEPPLLPLLLLEPHGSAQKERSWTFP